MKKTRFSVEQMVKILREADQELVRQVAKRHCISDQKLVAERDLEIEVMKEVAATMVSAARRGHAMSADRTHCLWRLAGLQVPSKRLRRRLAASRPRPLPPSSLREVLDYDFVFGACANGQQLKCLTIVDEFSREWIDMAHISPACPARTALT